MRFTSWQPRPAFAVDGPRACPRRQGVPSIVTVPIGRRLEAELALIEDWFASDPVALRSQTGLVVISRLGVA
jgi:hypothetical protein